MLFKNIYALGYPIVMLAAVFIVGEISRRSSIKVSRELISLIEVIALSGLSITAIGLKNLSRILAPKCDYFF